MDRRKFIGGVALGIVVAPLAAGAQPAVKVRQIAVLWGGTASTFAPGNDALRQGLRERGWDEGQNTAFVTRFAEGKLERLPDLAAELVALKVDMCITAGSEATRAAKDATSSIPIVFIRPSYPVEEGLVASFSRPGGNITGITLAQSDHVSKHLQLLRDTVPALLDVAVINSPANPGSSFTLKDTESVAVPLGIRIHSVPMGSADDVDRALATIARLTPGALVVHPVPLVFTHAQRISELALKLRAPSITAAKELAERGLLMSYGADVRDLWRRGVASYVDRVLKGAKPADLPVQRPTKFEFAINLKTAKTIGLTIPPPLLLRADEVIQ